MKPKLSDVHGDRNATQGIRLIACIIPYHLTQKRLSTLGSVKIASGLKALKGNLREYAKF